MGIQINGNTNNINAGIGSLSIEDLREIDIVGVATASNFKTGSSNLHSTGLTVGNNFLHSTGINVGTGATIHVPSSNVLTLGTNSNERLRISDSGLTVAGIATAQQVRYSAGSALYNGHPRSVVIGYSGSNYANLGMGWVPTSTNGQYTSANTDYQSRLELYDGLQIYGSGASVTSGQTVSWKNVADFKPSAIKLYTSGDSNSEKLRITSGGQVNIGGRYGETSALLSVTGASKGFPTDSTIQEANFIIKTNSTNNRWIGIGASNTAVWIQGTGPGSSGPTSNFCLNPAGGKIGINNTSPNTQLQVTAQTVNASTISTTNSKQLGLWIQATGGSNTTGHIENGIAFAEGYAGLYSKDAGSGAASELAFFTGAAAGVSERLRIATDGQLTHTTNKASDYTARFNQAHADNPAWIEINGPTDNNIRPTYIQLSQAGTKKWAIGQVYASTSDRALHFCSGSSSESNSKVVLTNTGNMGVGVPDPSTRLFVRNTHSNQYTGNAANVGWNGICVQNTNGHVSGGAYTGIQFNITGNSQNRVGAIGFISEDTSNRHGTLVFHTDDTTSRSEAMRIESTGRNMIVCNKNSANNTYYPKRQHRRSINASSAGSDWFRVAYLQARSKFRVHCSTTGGYYAPGTKSFTCIRNWDNTTFYLGEVDSLGSNWVTAARMQSDNGGGKWYLEVYFNNVSASQLSGFMQVVVEPQSGSSMTNTIELDSYGQNMSNLTYTSSQYNI